MLDGIVAELAVLGIIIAWRVPLFAWIDPMTWRTAVTVRHRLYTESYKRHPG